MMRDDYTAPCTIGRCRQQADHGRYTCTHCTTTMRAQLAEIDDYAAALTAEPGSGGGGGRQAPGFGSRSPARDDVIAALDPRTLPYAVGPDDHDGNIRPILATLTALAAWVAEEAGDGRTAHAPTVTSETGYLRSRVDWCTGQQWVDELAADLHELHAQCRRQAGDPPPKPAAPCPDCDGPLWSQGDVETVSLRCGTCAATYSGLDLLRIAQETTV